MHKPGVNVISKNELIELKEKLQILENN